MYMSLHVKSPYFLSYFNQTRISLIDLKKNHVVLNFMKIRPLTVLQVCGQTGGRADTETDRHEANSCFSRIWWTLLNIPLIQWAVCLAISPYPKTILRSAIKCFHFQILVSSVYTNVVKKAAYVFFHVTLSPLFPSVFPAITYSSSIP